MSRQIPARQGIGAGGRRTNQGACGGTPKRDGSGAGKGNRNTVSPPKPATKK